MPRGQADIANTALRIFLQEMGSAYDVERNLRPYNTRRDFAEVKEFFGDCCCYCGETFGPGRRAVQDHLIPMNKTDTGLHAWGNIVPACDDCNARKQGRNWQAFIIQQAGSHAKDRHDRVTAFLAKYAYARATTSRRWRPTCTRRSAASP